MWPVRWTSPWVWPQRSTDWDGPTPRRSAAMYTSFNLDKVPSRAPMRLATVGRVTCWVNGHEVCRGPVRVNPQRMVWEDADIAQYLRAGDNTIAMLVTADVVASAWSMPLPEASDLRGGAMACEVQLGDGRLLIADDTWKGILLSGWSCTQNEGLFKRGDELCDARSLPEHWSTDISHGDSWPNVRLRRATVFGGSGRKTGPTFPVGPLEGRPISQVTARRIELIRTSESNFAHDRIVVGTLLVDVDGPAGTHVTFTGAEKLSTTGEPMTEAYDSAFVLTLDGTRRTVESVNLFGVHGVRVEASDRVVVHGISVNERLHPVEGMNGFECSDDLLNDIYTVGRRTVSICSLDSYVDCPTREQRAWTGDSVVHQMVDLTTNDDWSLALWHPVLAASMRSDGMLPMAVAGDIEHEDMSIIPDWALHWVHSVHNVYMYTGDKERVSRLMHVVEAVVRWFVQYCDDDGLPVDMPGWVLIDWSSVYSDGANSTIAGLWGRALLEFAEMSDWLGDGGRASWARRTHEKLARGFEKFWDDERCVYVDTIENGVAQPMTSQHGQAAAIVGGLAPRSRWSQLVDAMCDESKLVHAAFARHDGPSDPGTETDLGGVYLFTGHPKPWWNVDEQIVRAQPFFRYVVHDALVAVGEGHRLAGLLRDWKWLIDRCDTSFSETWYGGTRCHGWSSTPTRDMIQRIAGVIPAVPGFDVVLVQPHLGDLDWARASVPSPHGSIDIDVRADEVRVVSPVPVVARVWGREERLSAGSHVLTRD